MEQQRNQPDQRDKADTRNRPQDPARTANKPAPVDEQQHGSQHNPGKPFDKPREGFGNDKK
jgi:hypothetical protein